MQKTKKQKNKNKKKQNKQQCQFFRQEKVTWTAFKATKRPPQKINNNEKTKNKTKQNKKNNEDLMNIFKIVAILIWIGLLEELFLSNLINIFSWSKVLTVSLKIAIAKIEIF